MMEPNKLSYLTRKHALEIELYHSLTSAMLVDLSTRQANDMIRNGANEEEMKAHYRRFHNAIHPDNIIEEDEC
jgi:hypothetical protein